jgi:cytochrome c oxidase subunit IV
VSEHVVSPKTYVVILLALLLGTYLTVSAALRDFGPWNIVIALAIATTKATLVVLFFMHAKYSPGRTKLVIFAGIFWLLMLLFMTLSDYVTRIEYHGAPSPSSQVTHREPMNHEFSQSTV